MTPARAPRRRSAARPSPGPPSPDLPWNAGLPMTAGGRDHPALGLGLWALGRWTREDEERTRATIERALARGISWFDTAEVYGTGRSERLLGDALARAKSLPHPPFVVTKVSWEHLRPSQVRASLLGSLQRLGRTEVDLYLVHAPDPRTAIPETMGALETLVDEGKTRAIGVSNFSLTELDAARSALTKTRLVVNQVRYNLFEREDVEPILEYCRGHGILIEAYTPLARGLLVGRYLDRGAAPVEVRRFARGLFGEDRFPEIRQRARAIRDLAARAKVPMTSITLHWLARQKVAPVFGASTPEELDEVLEAWSIRPPDEVLDRADEIARSGP